MDSWILTLGLYFYSCLHWSFFSTLMLGVWPPGTMRPSGVYVYVGGREGEKDRGSLGQGREWKVALIPAEHGGRGGSAVAGRGVFSDGGPGFNRDVRCDKDGPDRPAEWSCCDRAAILRIPYTAPSTAVTPSAPFFLIHAISLVALTYFICFSQCHGSVWCVKAWCVCPHSCQGAVWNLDIGAGRGTRLLFFFFF